MKRLLSLLAPLFILLGIAALLFTIPETVAQDDTPRPRPRLQIINASEQPIDVFWLKSETERIKNASVEPGADIIFTTSLGHSFEIVGRKDEFTTTVTSQVLVQAYRFDQKAKNGAPAFYTQHISANGFPIVASAKVNPYALKEAAFLVNMMLAKRPDVRKAMIQSGARMCIMAHDEYTTDLPEFQRMAKGEKSEVPGVSAKDFWDARARGLGGSEQDPLCTVAEENVLAFEGDPYEAENILIHEFAHNIHLRGMLNVDPTFDKRLRETYDAAMKAGLWKGKYAAVNHYEYFAEGVQSWFDDNRVNDHDHNHVHLRSQLIEYDPGLAALCREVFGDTELKYTKPTTRLKDHMAGYDPHKSPAFVWPERLQKVKTAIRELAQNRNAKAHESDTHEARQIEGWTVIISRVLAQKDAAALEKAMKLLTAQLVEIQRIVPKDAVAKLQQVRLYFNPEYHSIAASAEYHPGSDWLSANQRDPQMAKNIEFTNVSVFEEDCQRMPLLVLHELAHAYHDRFLPEGHNNPEIKAAFEKATASGKYDKVERRDHLGNARMDKAYAMTNAAEYFAETTEAYFGTNDFYPYNREQLQKHDPQMLALLGKLWGAPH
jgi:Mlc titration factor MtfA (ptsG expression regulator)